MATIAESGDRKWKKAVWFEALNLLQSDEASRQLKVGLKIRYICKEHPELLIRDMVRRLLD